MPVKFAYDAAWNQGTIHVEAGSLDELTKIVKDLKENNVNDKTHFQPNDSATATSDDYPQIGGDTGCASAIRTILSSEWGRMPRTEAELTEAMKANAINYQRGTISGLLINLTRKGELRRVGKKNGSYAYAINIRKNITPTQAALITA